MDSCGDYIAMLIIAVPIAIVIVFLCIALTVLYQ